MPFEFTPLELPGVSLVTSTTFTDDRGWFNETYKRSASANGGITDEFVQDNLSWSTQRGTVRGLHYQLRPAAQGKLVRCIRGSIFDVAVDIRKGSPTEGRWLSVKLHEADGRMLWIPEGFAHGFQTLVNEVLVLYKTTAEYSPNHEAGIAWNDPGLAIGWPIESAVLSPRDANLPRRETARSNFDWAVG